MFTNESFDVCRSKWIWKLEIQVRKMFDKLHCCIRPSSYQIISMLQNKFWLVPIFKTYIFIHAVLFFTLIHFSFLILVGSTAASFLLLKTSFWLKKKKTSLTSSMKCKPFKSHLWFKWTAKWLLRKLKCSPSWKSQSEISNSSVQTVVLW